MHVADSLREDKLAAKNERIAGLVAEIEMAKQSGSQESEADNAVTLSTCRLLPNDIMDIYSGQFCIPRTQQCR